MTFLEQTERFRGTGERDSFGRTLEEFLAAYDGRQYETPANTADIVVVRCKEPYTHWGQPIQILMVKRKNHPSIGFWATPGGFVEMKEDLYTAACRELEEETGVRDLPLKQLSTWGAYDRDPRWRVITTSFVALAEGELAVQAGDDAADAVWMDAELSLEEACPDEKQTGKKEIWRLTLRNMEKEVQAFARVELTHSGHPLLSQTFYRLLESDQIAVDHGCIITEALLYLKGQLCSNGRKENG